MKPTLIAHPFAKPFSNILKKFEDGKPLSSDQLNFLLHHEKTLKSYALDPVIKYYLSSHLNKASKSNPLPIPFPKQNLSEFGVQQIKQTVQTLLHNDLSHVDLKMTLEQFMQFKAIGIHEIVFWHIHPFMSRLTPFRGIAIPQAIYFQWGKLFGVVKMNISYEQDVIEGDVLIYLEDMHFRNLNQCVMDYAKNHKVELQKELTPNIQLTNTLIASPQIHEEESQHHALTLKPFFHEII